MFDKEIIEEIETLHEHEFGGYLQYDEMTTPTSQEALFESRLLSEQLKVVKALSMKEKWQIEKELYNEKVGYRLHNAYLLKNACPKCRYPLYILHYSGGKGRFGGKGYLLYCPTCKQNIGFLLTKVY